ncbi:MAG: hypothetical protein DME65_11820 [Verrucomicrobia bacterium]|nr:MAG: hypothetical protein DME65_11820 [Verrucomicrobiota bacterium]
MKFALRVPREQADWRAHASSVPAVAFRDRELCLHVQRAGRKQTQKNFASAKCRSQHATSVRSPKLGDYTAGEAPAPQQLAELQFVSRLNFQRS